MLNEMLDRDMRQVSIAGTMLAIVALLWFTNPFGCSQSCTQTVKSEQEARLAVGAFFSSDTTHTRGLIASLRHDGMFDEYLNKLKAGCVGCYVYAGYRRNEDPNAWYVVASIASPSAKKDVVLLVECANAVWNYGDSALNYCALPTIILKLGERGPN